eukprot:963922-Rhodomonas_salina.8
MTCLSLGGCRIRQAICLCLRCAMSGTHLGVPLSAAYRHPGTNKAYGAIGALRDVRYWRRVQCHGPPMRCPVLTQRIVLLRRATT